MMAAHRQAALVVALICLLPALTFSARAAAAPLGLYVGGAIGHTQMHAGQAVVSAPTVGSTRFEFDGGATGWQVLVGVRPLPIVGFELAYFDFGRARIGSASSLPAVAEASKRATALFAVAQLPIPLLHIYGKLGLARATGNATLSATGGTLCPFAASPGCPYAGFNPTLYHKHVAGAALAYGAGAVLQLSSLGVRLDYTGLTADGFPAQMVSLGVTWRL